MTYIINEDGEIEKTDQVFTNGRYQFIDGKVVRVGDGTKGPTHYAGSDDLGQAILNHADGKMYDSRSAYYKAVKAKGLEVIGNDSPVRAPKTKKVNWEKAVAETLKRTPLKGKRK